MCKLAMETLEPFSIDESAVKHRKDTIMKQFTELVIKRPKLAKGLIYGYTIFNGIWMFPLRLSTDFSEIFLYGVTIYVYWIMGAMLLGLHPEKVDRSIVTVFACHGLGLLLRVILEWGEASMVRDLTTMNVSVYLLAVPLIVAISYRVNRKKQNNE